MKGGGEAGCGETWRRCGEGLKGEVIQKEAERRGRGKNKGNVQSFILWERLGVTLAIAFVFVVLSTNMKNLHATNS